MPTTKINGSQQFTTSLDVDFNAKKITNLADPTLDQDAATKLYVDSVAVGLSILLACRAATTVTGGDIALSGTQTVDGVSLSVGDRVLVKNQTLGAQNGIYVVLSGAWARSTDADENAEVKTGMFTFVSEGTSQQGTGWVLSTPAPITVDTTPLTFTQFSGAATYSAGVGLQLTGSVFSVKTVSSTRITVTSGGIDLATTAVSANTYGPGSTTDYKVPYFSVDGYGRLTAAGSYTWFGSVTPNYIFAGPGSGSAGLASFRALNFLDMIPGLATTETTTSTAANGELLIGNGANFTLTTLTLGTSISIANASGSITITNTGATSVRGTTNQITANGLYTSQTGNVVLAFPTTGVTLPQKTTLTASATGYASLNIPTGTAPTSPNAGDIWFVTATGILAYYGSTLLTHTLADLDSVQTFTANKTLTNPTLATIAASTSDTSALFLSSGNKMVTRTLGTNAFSSGTIVGSITGTANRITATGTTDITIDIASTYVGQTSITTLGTVATGVWSATTIAVNKGGTGQTSYVNGELLIGNTTGNTLSKGNLIAGANIAIAAGPGTITISADNAVDITKFIFGEDLTRLGAEGTPGYTLLNTPVTDKEAIFVNGLYQKRTVDYTISGNTITFQTGAIPQANDIVTAIYIKS